VGPAKPVSSPADSASFNLGVGDTMSQRTRFSSMTRAPAILLALVLVASSVSAAEWKEKVLYSFQGGADGSLPAGGVVFDSAGNLYGATADGGLSCPPPGCGTVFQLAPPAKKGDPWTETILHVFDSKDGTQPTGGLVIDSKGNLYGVTGYGGSGGCQLLGSRVGCGLVYELSPPGKKGGAWTETVVYSFQGGEDGQYPTGDLVFDIAGNLYGATIYGGGYGTCNAPYYLYCGTVFKLSPPVTGGKWKEKVLYAFKSGTDGASTNGGLVLDSAGNLYGTTFYGGNEAGECKYGVGGTGCGTVFELDRPKKKGATWSEKIIHRFQGGQDGDYPAAGLIIGENRDLYGTTLTGGGNGGGGTVFCLTPPTTKGRSWKKAILHGFDGVGGGLDAESSLILDSNGDLYGTTLDSGGIYYGTVFRLKRPKQEGATWIFNLLYGFQAPPDGGQPAAGLVFDKSNNLYGTTTQGGSGTGCSFHGCGTVFEISP
jgi:hypothetical protein